MTNTSLSWLIGWFKAIAEIARKNLKSPTTERTNLNLLLVGNGLILIGRFEQTVKKR